ncbi:unnamed protein product [Porites evermanni]|uniref:Uncharacterized protein n=1 Tax=Porites evermanni TaxID=104178 RepID=A0ABN8SDW0_9CNID|nr:unnamed protein product [Porites evermanni]
MRSVNVLFLLMLSFHEMKSACGYECDPCAEDIKVLSSKDRAAGFQKLTRKSDRIRRWKETWYKFTGGAGDKMATADSNGTYCITPPSCGAKFPGYLDGDHPADLKVGESVKRTVCFSNGRNCCVWRQEIEILKCKDFFIYKLPKVPFRRARYCGNKVFLLSMVLVSIKFIKKETQNSGKL